MRKWIAVVGATIASMNFAMAEVASVDVQGAAYTEGKQYLVLPDAAREQPTAKALLASTPKNQVQLLAFFNYGCPVCNRIEPMMDRWYNEKKPLNIVQAVDVPVVWTHPGWDQNARAFYMAQALNILPKAQPALFKAIHEDHKDLSTREALQSFFMTELGIKPDQFDATYDSFDVRRKLKQSELLGKEYNIQRIPSFIVNGHYYVDVETAGGLQETIDVVNYLVNKESFTHDEESLRFDEVKAK